MKERWKRFLFILVYRLLFFPVLFVLLPGYCLKIWRRGGYRRHFLHRFGFVPKNMSRKPTLWLQAVSVGEVEALQPLLELLQPHYCIYLTTTTSTGFQIAQKKYRQLATYIAYFPLDFWSFSKRAWQRIHPDTICLMESEFWPEHLYQAFRRSCSVYLINGRCSDKTFSRYQKFPSIARLLLGYVTNVLAISEVDGGRFAAFCKPTTAIEVVGNLKVDAALHQLKNKQTILRQHLGEAWTEATILLGASTWPGEEKCLIETFLEARKQHPSLRLILVPRHVERRYEVEQLLKIYPLKACLRTKPQLDADVYIVDTTGELRQFITLADIVFIGKSLAPNQGGQTPVEAASLGKPILYGPHMENFRTICQSLEAAKAACCCSDEKAVKMQIREWLSKPQVAAQFGQNALAWTHQNSGTTMRTFKILMKLGKPR